MSQHIFSHSHQMKPGETIQDIYNSLPEKIENGLFKNKDNFNPKKLEITPVFDFQAIEFTLQTSDNEHCFNCVLGINEREQLVCTAFVVLLSENLVHKFKNIFEYFFSTL